MPNKNLELFNPTCPEGGKWYACEVTKENKSPFAGCCKSDPCSINGCSAGNTAPVAFNASRFDSLPDASCGAASQFYTCVNIPKNDTTFWGCCKSNPCQQNQKCPTADLTAAIQDTPAQQLGFNKDRDNMPEDSGSGVSTGVIVGAAVGGGVAVVAIIAILIFCLCRKRRAKNRPSSSSASPSAFPDTTNREKTEYRHSTVSEAAPPYSSPNAPPFAFTQTHAYAPVAPNEPQELPADFSTGPVQRYSELPDTNLSSLPPAELESPMVRQDGFPSPQPSPQPSPLVPSSSLRRPGTGTQGSPR